MGVIAVTKRRFYLAPISALPSKTGDVRCWLLPAEHAAPGGQARSRGRLQLTQCAGPDTREAARGRHWAIKAKGHETRL